MAHGMDTSRPLSIERPRVGGITRCVPRTASSSPRGWGTLCAARACVEGIGRSTREPGVRIIVLRKGTSKRYT